MKILVIHNRYKILGGEDLSTEAEVTLLKCNGIEVHTFYVDNADIDIKHKSSLALNTVWSNRYYREIIDLIEKEKYTIVHVQNFFPLLSPSIFYACQKTNTKVVMSVRNYRLICPNAQMYVNGQVCTACVGKKIPFRAITKKCYRKSAATSAAVVAMLSFHNFLNTWKNKIDGYICVSEFVKTQLMLGGFEGDNIYVKHNFVRTDIKPSFEDGDYYIFAGRLSEEKGIDILLKSFEKSAKKLIVVGTGPMSDMVQAFAKVNKNVAYLGKLPLDEIYHLISKAKALIFPSKWHEPFGRTIVEAFAHGTPVIGSAMGGITELITNHYNGFLFNPHDEHGLEKAILMLESVQDIRAIRKNTYDTYQKSFLPADNFSRIMSIYQQVLSA